MSTYRIVGEGLNTTTITKKNEALRTGLNIAKRVHPDIIVQVQEQDGDDWKFVAAWKKLEKADVTKSLKEEDLPDGLVYPEALDQDDFVHPFADSMDDEDYEFAHNDGAQEQFSLKHLGHINFKSSWEMANYFRYCVVVNQFWRLGSATRAVEVLDMGCSRATLFSFYRHSYGGMGKPKVNYQGLEIRDEIIAQVDKIRSESKSRDTLNIKKWDCMKNRLTELPNMYDLVVMQEILEHLEPEWCVKCIQDSPKILNPGGRIIVSSPNPKKHEGEEFVWAESHVKEYPIHEMIEIIKEAGLIVTDIKGWLGKGMDLKRRMTAEELELYQALNTASPALSTAIIALVKPELAQCYTMVCAKPEELKGKVLRDAEELTERYSVLIDRPKSGSDRPAPTPKKPKKQDDSHDLTAMFGAD